MAKLVAGMASSHAYTFVEPERWEERREVTRQRYLKRMGTLPPVQPQIERETLAGNLERYRDIHDGLMRLKAAMDTLRPDVLLLIGDDQNENYRQDNLPQLAIYTGERLVAREPERGITGEFHTDVELAERILNEGVEAGFDLAFSRTFHEDRVLSHAHTQVLNFLQPRMPVVLVFMNAINVPAPTPARCYQFGQALRRIVEGAPGDRRVVAYASGGLSHFTAGYPWGSYQGPCGLGSICEEFDHRAVGWMRAGEGERLASLTSRDLLDNGAIELRQWITLQGLLDGGAPEWLVYEPFYRAVMAMGVGYWPLN